jgi:uncharacterized Tic20 family protein
METTNNKNTATLLHLSILSQYIFPFGNFILPIVIWSATKKNGSFIDNSGRNAINFQLSLFLYSVILCLIAIPVLMYTIFSHVPFEAMVNGEDFIANFSMSNLTGISVVAAIAFGLFCMMKTAEFFLVIYAAVKAANGEIYQYPLTINFIKGEKYTEPTILEPATSTE